MIFAIVPGGIDARDALCCRGLCQKQVFAHLEENLKSLTGTVARCRQQLNEGANSAQQNGAW